MCGSWDGQAAAAPPTAPRACGDGNTTAVQKRVRVSSVHTHCRWVVRLAPPQEQEHRDLLEIIEDRYGTRSTLVTSQLSPGQWHDHIGEPTLAAAPPPASPARRG
jgi:IstB-like ATP binding protein